MFYKSKCAFYFNDSSVLIFDISSLPQKNYQNTNKRHLFTKGFILVEGTITQGGQTSMKV